jgi:hypothetical protein
MPTPQSLSTPQSIGTNNPNFPLSDITSLLPAACTADPEIFELVLDFIYSTEQSKFTVPVDKVFYLVKISDILAMKSLFKRCAAALEIYTPPFAVQLLQQGENCCLPDTDEHLSDLREVCLAELVEFFEGFTYSKERRKEVFALPFEMQKKILGDLQLGIENEDVVFEYVLE